MIDAYDRITAEVINDELELNLTSYQIDLIADIVTSQNENRGLGGPDLPDATDFAAWEWQPKLDTLESDKNLQIKWVEDKLRDMEHSRDYWRNKALYPDRF